MRDGENIGRPKGKPIGLYAEPTFKIGRKDASFCRFFESCGAMRDLTIATTHIPDRRCLLAGIRKKTFLCVLRLFRADITEDIIHPGKRGA